MQFLSIFRAYMDLFSGTGWSCIAIKMILFKFCCQVHLSMTLFIQTFPGIHCMNKKLSLVLVWNNIKFWIKNLSFKLHYLYFLLLCEWILWNREKVYNLIGNVLNYANNLSFIVTYFSLFSILDDVELYEQQKPFCLDDLVSISSFLNQLVFKLIWNNLIGTFSIFFFFIYFCLNILKIFQFH